MMDKNELFSELIIKHSKDIQRFIFTLTRDNYAKDDIMQNSIIRAYKSFDGLKDMTKFLSWMLSITRTETARYYNAEKLWKDMAPYEEGMPQDVYDARADFKKLEGNEVGEAVRKIIYGLKPEIAQVLILYFDYDLNLKDIAKSLNRNYNTVKSQYIRGIETVKEQYCKAAEEKGDLSWMAVK